MPSSYELWLLDDQGRRIVLLNSMLESLGYFSYSRTTKGYGTCLIGIPYENYIQKVYPLFQPDWRVDIWRSPEVGYDPRHEGTYLLRMPKVYTREQDNVRMVALYGRDAKDLLRRRYVIQPAGYSQTAKTDYIDDMMKEIVTEQMVFGSCLDVEAAHDNSRAYPQGEFTVQGDVSLGPLLTKTFADRNVIDILKELREASFQLYDQDPLSYNRIYFDVIPVDLKNKFLYILDEETGDPITDEEGYELIDESSPNPSAVQGFEFVTYAGLRGQDRTGSALIFSEENNNLKGPYYTLNYMEEENSVIVKGFGRGDSRAYAIVTDDQRAWVSRWNLCEGFEDASTEPDQTNLDNYAYPPLYAGIPKEDIGCVFLNVSGSDDTPRSLYGIDWDLGDLLPVDFIGKRFNVLVDIVYVAIDEDGRETITGQNDISAQDQ